MRSSSDSLPAVTVGVASGTSLTDWLIAWAMPTLPALLDAAEVADAHRRQAQQKGQVEAELFQPAWESALTGTDPTKVDCRRLQDEVFQTRLNGAQVPEWFYWRRRDRSGVNMEQAAAERVADYRAWPRNERHPAMTSHDRQRPKAHTNAAVDAIPRVLRPVRCLHLMRSEWAP